MLPPHCGQTRLMIEEMMLAFDSPGIASMFLTLSSCSVTRCKRNAMSIEAEYCTSSSDFSTNGIHAVWIAGKHLADDRLNRVNSQLAFR